jgi:hypothetical protein
MIPTRPRARRLGFPAAALLVAMAAPAAALPPLSENGYIHDRLLAAQIGDLIAKTCPSITARDTYALFQALKLKSYANDLGYSDAEIKAFIRSPAEKKRVKDAALRYMKAKGVVEGDAESYCTLGRDEIARKSITGTLLRAK